MTNPNTKPVALIREAECIGCTKCIDACPVDAIIGSRQVMHTVIANECIGCELCLPPCPIDCIDLVPAKETVDPARTRTRVLARKARLRQPNLHEKNDENHNTNECPDPEARRAYIDHALKRIQKKKAGVA